GKTAHADGWTHARASVPRDGGDHRSGPVGHSRRIWRRVCVLVQHTCELRLGAESPGRRWFVPRRLLSGLGESLSGHRLVTTLFPSYSVPCLPNPQLPVSREAGPVSASAPRLAFSLAVEVAQQFEELRDFVASVLGEQGPAEHGKL